MRHRRTLLALAALAALAPAPVARGQQAGGINFIELFQALDANNDAVITRSEVPESGRDAFDRLLKLGDSNSDGKIDREEYRALLERARDSMNSAPLGPGPRFTAMDKDGDNRVSRAEFTGPPPMFDRIDADKDGFLTRDEARTFAAAVLGPGANTFGPRFRAMDANGDGKVSRAEFTGPAPQFDRIDANKDGQLVPAEVRRFQLSQMPAAKKAAQPAQEGSK